MPAQPEAAQHAGGADEPARPQPIDQPAVERLHPRLKQDEQREAPTGCPTASSRGLPAAASTNSVQAYCRLAIMIIATSDAHELEPAVVQFMRHVLELRSRAVSRTRRPRASPASARPAARPVRRRRRRRLRAPSAGRLRDPAASTSCARRLFRRRPCAGRSRSAARCPSLRRDRLGFGHDLAHERARPRDARTICSSVAPVSALIGLNATLPSSFTQISWRKRVRDRAAEAARRSAPRRSRGSAPTACRRARRS